MRNGNGEARGVATESTNHALETINAAATAIASVEDRLPQAAVQKKRWGGCLSLYWCFGSQKQRKRIGHAVFVPEATGAPPDAPATQNLLQSTTIMLPFVAPPSSPASFVQSGPPSATQSPAGMLSLTSISASMYSPSGPHSMFAIGPYAHETQLVSPPVLSTFTTEPSTAPITPPPESVHLTTPSSPEVPFAHVVNTNLQSSDTCAGFPFYHYEFQSYQLSPGSPVGHLISPGSCFSGSGTSSPFPGREFPVGFNILEFQSLEPPKLLNLDKLCTHELESRRYSGSPTPDHGRSKCRDGFLLHCKVASYPPPVNECQNDAPTGTNRVSFELRKDNVKSREGKWVALAGTPSGCANYLNVERENICSELDNRNEGVVSGTPNDEKGKVPLVDGESSRHQRLRSITLGSSREFNFDNAEGRDAHGPNMSSSWWNGETVVEEENGSIKNWSFPVVQQSVS